jgi:phosphotransferase system enzyme I (PtsI)
MDLANYNLNDKLVNVELKGNGSSGTIAMGIINFLFETKKISKRKISEEKVEEEIAKFNNAKVELENEFQLISQNLNYEFDKIAEIYQINIMLLNDPIINDEIVEKIKSLFSAVYSVEYVFNRFIKQLRLTNDLLLKERANSIEEIKKLLIDRLSQSSKINISKNDILIAKNIDTNSIYHIKESEAAGFVCEDGGLTSHAAIVARAFNITSIINVKNLIRCCKKGDYAIIDSINNKFIINPNSELINSYKHQIKEIEKKNKKLAKILDKESKTIDNKPVKIKSNLDNLIELKEYNLIKSDGIGLVRTEILLNVKEIFSEKIQIEKYSEIAKSVYPKDVTFRVFDIGSDKYPDGFNFKEQNPALGVRGIRFLFKNISIFKTQISALLKSSELKNIKILIPMISNINDVLFSLQIIEEVKDELIEKRVSFDKKIKVGFMIETPSAAFLTKKISKYADFISIGTNDLSQYLFAADRTNNDCIDYLDNNSPTLFSVINKIVDDAKLNNIEVSVCGEIAYDLHFTKLLIGTGVDELSLSYSNIPVIKNELINSKYSDCKLILEEFIEKEN